jgi:hypothetical protein
MPDQRSDTSSEVGEQTSKCTSENPSKSGPRSIIRTHQTTVYKQMMSSRRPKKGSKWTEKTASKKFTYPALEDRIRVSTKMQFQNGLAHRPLGSQSMGISQTPFSLCSIAAPAVECPYTSVRHIQLRDWFRVHRVWRRRSGPALKNQNSNLRAHSSYSIIPSRLTKAA